MHASALCTSYEKQMSRDKIAAISLASTTPVMPYVFVPAGKLDIKIGDRSMSVDVGELYYMNNIIRIDGCIKIDDWYFCLEKNTHIENSQWVIGGFIDMTHYSFLQLKGDMCPLGTTIDDIKLRILIEFVITRIIPIIDTSVLPGQKFEYSLRET